MHLVWHKAYPARIDVPGGAGRVRASAPRPSACTPWPSALKPCTHWHVRRPSESISPRIVGRPQLGFGTLSGRDARAPVREGREEFVEPDRGRAGEVAGGLFEAPLREDGEEIADRHQPVADPGAVLRAVAL